MIEQRTIYKCDLCGEEVHVKSVFRVQHLVDNSDMNNVKSAGIELYSIQESMPFAQASTTCVCFRCCKTICQKETYRR